MVSQNFTVHVKINSVCVAQDFTCVFQIILAMQLVTNENERPILEEHNMLQIEVETEEHTQFCPNKDYGHARGIVP